MKAEEYYAVKGKCFYGVEAAVEYATRLSDRQRAPVDVEQVMGSRRQVLLTCHVHRGQAALNQMHAMLEREARGESELVEVGQFMSCPGVN